MHPGMYNNESLSGIGGPKVLTDPKKLKAALAMINADRKKQGKPPVAAKPKMTVADVVKAAQGVATRGLDILKQVQGIVAPPTIAPPPPPLPPPAASAGLMGNPMMLAAVGVGLFLLLRKRR